MEVKEYFVADSEGKSNCIVRSFCKLFNKEYEVVRDELQELADKLCYESFTEVEVFETYLTEHHMPSIDYGWDVKIKDLKLDEGEYAIFCWDKKEFYHMICVIDNVIYDKNDKCLDLYAVAIYKKEK